MKKHKGFTIVELLIAIVIIAILASLGVAAYNGIQQRARYANTVDSVKKVEKAFRLKAISDGGYKSDIEYSNCIYATEPSLSSYGLGNPPIGWIISYCNDDNPLKNYLRASDYYAIGTPLYYDNDMDAYPSNCSSFSTAGVNLFFGVDALTSDTLIGLDRDLDDNNGLLCGKVRTNNGSAFPTHQQYYMMAASPTDTL